MVINFGRKGKISGLQESLVFPRSKFQSSFSKESYAGTLTGDKDNTFFSFFFFNKVIYLLIYFWLHWFFVAVRRFSLVAVSGGYSSLPCAGFSLWWLLLLQSTGFRHAGFSSCGTWAQ